METKTKKLVGATAAAAAVLVSGAGSAHAAGTNTAQADPTSRVSVTHLDLALSVAKQAPLAICAQLDELDNL